MNATADGIAAFIAFVSDPDGNLTAIFAVEHAYEVDMRDIDEGWMP